MITGAETQKQPKKRPHKSGRNIWFNYDEIRFIQGVFLVSMQHLQTNEEFNEVAKSVCSKLRITTQLDNKEHDG